MAPSRGLRNMCSIMVPQHSIPGIRSSLKNLSQRHLALGFALARQSPRSLSPRCQAAPFSGYARPEPPSHFSTSLVSSSHHQTYPQPKQFHTTATAEMAEEKEKDWSAAQYLKFGNERTRPVHDLVAQLRLEKPFRRIIDLGCGPGNSTAVLAENFPGARISGVDASPDMLARARATLPAHIDVSQADLAHWVPPSTAEEGGEGPDLLFSNAMLHWLRHPVRIPTVLRLLAAQPAGGVFAFQVPDNFMERSHRSMREVAASPGPWRVHFEAHAAAHPEDPPALDPIEDPAEWYDALAPHCERINLWRTQYHHVLAGPQSIVEWVKGSGLQPFMNALPEGEVRDAFVKAYGERIAELYPRLVDGKVLLVFPRLFIVAVKK